MFRNFIIYFFILIVLCSCAASGIVYLDVLRPATLTIDSSIRRPAILPRMNPLSAVELTARIYSSKLSGNDALEYVNRRMTDHASLILSQSPRFNRPLTALPVLFSSDTSFSQIRWTLADSLCSIHHCDGLIALDYLQMHDSFSIFYNPEWYAYQASLWMFNSSIWRVYNIKERRVDDEYLVRDTLYRYATGETPLSAVLALPDVYTLLDQSSVSAAYTYAYRIAPYWLTEKRHIYTYGHYDLFMAGYYAAGRKWDKAVEIWEHNTRHPKASVRAKAAYNAAVAAEMNDDLDKALAFAEMSYAAEPLNQTLKYIKLLKNRIIIKEQINSQLYFTP